LFAGSFIVNGGGSWAPGAIYSDANWGMLFRPKVTGNVAAFSFHNYDDTVNILSMLNTGNVGIGTTTPSEKLVVNGNVKSSGFCINSSCITSWAQAGSGSWIGGSGTAGKIPRYTPDGTTLGNSSLTSDGNSATATGNFFITPVSNSGNINWFFGSGAWGGAAPATTNTNSSAGLFASGGAGSQLFTLASVAAQASLQLDGSLFVGDTITYNPYSTTGSTPGSLLVQGNSAFGGNVSVQNSVTANSFCIGASCVTSWPSGGSGTIGGSGTGGMVPRYTSNGTTLGNSSLASDGNSTTANGNFFVSGTSGNGIKVTASGTTYGPYLGLLASGSNGHEWDLISDQAGNGFGAGAFELYDATVGQTRLTISPSGVTTIGAGLTASGSLSSQNGATPEILANGDDHTGGGIAVSNDGGFYDYNDNWITFNGTSGLKIAGNSGKNSTGGQLFVTGNVGASGKDPNSGYPSGWAGGVHSFDIYAEGTMGAGPAGGPVAAYINNAGTVGGNSFCLTGTCITSWSQTGSGASLSGTTNYLPKFTSGSTIGNSLVYDTGTSVGVGTASPAYTFDVNGSLRSNYAVYAANGGGFVDLVPGNSTQSGYMAWFKPDGSTRLGYMGWDPNNISLNLENGANFTVSNGNVQLNGNGLLNSRGNTILQTNATDWLRINQDVSYPNGIALYGSVAVGAGGLAVGTWSTVASGNIQASGSVTAASFLYSSDRRLKKNIEPLTDNLSKILHIQPVSYLWKDPSRGTGEQIGFIAQNVQSVAPQIVHTDASTTLESIDYARLTPFLVGSVQELNAKIEAQQKQIDEQQKQIDALQEAIANLKSN
jgi:hypothetical protein